LTIADLIAALRKTLSSLTQAGVEDQMRDFLSPEELPGLEKKIRIGVNKLFHALNENSLET
jgi:hypothetical protein